MTFIFSVHDIHSIIDINEFDNIRNVIDTNKSEIISFYGQKGKSVFDNDGHSICVIKGTTLDLKDFSEKNVWEGC